MESNRILVKSVTFIPGSILTEKQSKQGDSINIDIMNPGKDQVEQMEVMF